MRKPQSYLTPQGVPTPDVYVHKAWIDPKQKDPKSIHDRGYGTFAVDGEILQLKSKMR